MKIKNDCFKLKRKKIIIMDTNTLIEVIKSSTPVIQSSLSAVVGAVISTLFLRKNTNTTEFEKIKVGLFKQVASELLESGKMTYYEFYKCNNFLRVAELADEIRNDSKQDEETENKEYDFDWFVRFFDAVSAISNEDMQRLWAKILNGEIQQQGSFSFRTLETLRNLSQMEAEIFCNTASIVLNDAIIFSSLGDIGQDINEKYGFDNTVLRLLEECGLINGLRMQNQLTLEPDEAGGFSLDGKLLLFKNISDDSLILDYTCYNLTRVGLELFPVVYRPCEKNAYLIELGRAIREKYNTLQVSIHPINSMDEDSDSVSYDATIDLLN